MSRKLATIREIKNIKPIEGADQIECATVDGWDVVVKKGEVKIGDKVCYFEIDSFLPAIKQFEFLAKSSTKTMNGVIGYRLKTIKLRGQVSQGLILPLSEFNIKGNIGDDLTLKLGVRLWELPQKTSNPVPAKGARAKFYIIKNKVEAIFPKTEIIFRILDKLLFKAKYVKRFPNFIKKTDQERIQNMVGRLDELRNIPFEATIKLDGSSLTIFRNENKTGVCSRNFDVSDEDNNYIKINKTYKITDTLKKYKKNIAIQGEMIGEGIQGNNEKIPGIDFYVFDIYDINKKRYMTRNERFDTLKDLHDLECNLKHVPTFDKEFYIGDKTLEDMLKLAEGKSLFSKNREGLVFKSNVLYNNKTVSFKCISNKYLLKQED